MRIAGVSGFVYLGTPESLQLELVLEGTKFSDFGAASHHFYCFLRAAVARSLAYRACSEQR